MGKKQDLSSYEGIKSEFKKTCEELSTVRSLHEVVRDFAELGRITIMNRRTPFFSQKDEDVYLTTIKKYNPEEQQKLAELLAFVVLAHNVRHGDFLGEVLMEMKGGSKQLGQFFTPYATCLLQAQLTLTAESVKGKEYVTLSEPASGGGGLIIAAHEHAKSLGVELYAHAVELSHMVADLCYINLSAAGVAAHVTQGDSLTLKMGRSFPTPELCTQVWVDRLRKREEG